MAIEVDKSQVDMHKAPKDATAKQEQAELAGWVYLKPHQETFPTRLYPRQHNSTVVVRIAGGFI